MVYGRKSLGRRCFVGNLFHGGHRCISLREREVWSCRTCDVMEGPGDSPVPCQTPGWTPPLLSLDVLSLSLGLFMYAVAGILIGASRCTEVQGHCSALQTVPACSSSMH